MIEPPDLPSKREQIKASPSHCLPFPRSQTNRLSGFRFLFPTKFGNPPKPACLWPQLQILSLASLRTLLPSPTDTLTSAGASSKCLKGQRTYACPAVFIYVGFVFVLVHFFFPLFNITTLSFHPPFVFCCISCEYPLCSGGLPQVSVAILARIIKGLYFPFQLLFTLMRSLTFSNVAHWFSCPSIFRRIGSLACLSEVGKITLGISFFLPLPLSCYLWRDVLLFSRGPVDFSSFPFLLWNDVRFGAVVFISVYGGTQLIGGSPSLLLKEEDFCAKDCPTPLPCPWLSGRHHPGVQFGYYDSQSFFNRFVSLSKSPLRESLFVYGSPTLRGDRYGPICIFGGPPVS